VLSCRRRHRQRDGAVGGCTCGSSDGEEREGAVTDWRRFLEFEKPFLSPTQFPLAPH
jgi:hypothetical protein